MQFAGQQRLVTAARSGDSGVELSLWRLPGEGGRSAISALRKAHPEGSIRIEDQISALAVNQAGTRLAVGSGDMTAIYALEPEKDGRAFRFVAAFSFPPEVQATVLSFDPRQSLLYAGRSDGCLSVLSLCELSGGQPSELKRFQASRDYSPITGFTIGRRMLAASQSGIMEILSSYYENANYVLITPRRAA